MSSIGPINPIQAAELARISNLAPAPELRPPAGGAAPTGGFGQMLDGLVSMVDARQDHAQAVTKEVLLGQTDQLHQSIIAMQEASVAFSLMVEVRNKLIESYQELMRMQV